MNKCLHNFLLVTKSSRKQRINTHKKQLSIKILALSFKLQNAAWYILYWQQRSELSRHAILQRYAIDSACKNILPISTHYITAPVSGRQQAVYYKIRHAFAKRARSKDQTLTPASRYCHAVSVHTIGGNVFDALVKSPQGPTRLSLARLRQAPVPNEPTSCMQQHPECQSDVLSLSAP